MKTSIAKYLTRSGKVAMEVFMHETRKDVFTYSYSGLHGAGSGSDLAEVKERVMACFLGKAGIKQVETSKAYELGRSGKGA